MDVNALKVGDRVGISGYGWNPLCEIRTVKKRTATQVVLDDDSRWNKYGRKIGRGSTYHRQYLMPEADAAKHIADELKRRKRLALIGNVRDLDFKNIDDDGLRMILQVAKDHTF